MADFKYKNGDTWYSLLKDIVYPVGSIYFSYTSVSPANSIGGTWTQIPSGSYIRSASSVSTGGSTEITVANLPSDMGTLDLRASSGSSTDKGGDTAVGATDNSWGGIFKSSDVIGWPGTHAVLQSKEISSPNIQRIELGGSGRAFYPTYQNLYIYRRTA